MSDVNPYSPSENVSPSDFGVRKVGVRPIQLMRRGYDLVGDQYWLFLGIALVGILVGSAVPLGLLIGAMMAGIYLCYIEREQGRHVEFGTLFKGFDYFMDTLIAWLFMFLASMFVIVPFMIAMFVLVFLPVIQEAANAAANNAPPPTPDFPVAFFILYPLMFIVNMMVTMPFIFVFQLIADRKVKAMEAVRLSFRGFFRNFWGVVWFFVVLMFVSILLAMMCYVPAILFMPISFGAMFLLYRDIFGPSPAMPPTVT